LLPGSEARLLCTGCRLCSGLCHSGRQQLLPGSGRVRSGLCRSGGVCSGLCGADGVCPGDELCSDLRRSDELLLGWMQPEVWSLQGWSLLEACFVCRSGHLLPEHLCGSRQQLLHANRVLC